MPTLFRLLVFVGVVAGLVYAAMWGLATYVHPQQHEILQTIKLPPAPK